MIKNFSLFLNFNGNCREALDFYVKLFESEVQDLMTYGDMPPDPDFPIEDADKDKILYSNIPIYGSNIMFCDVPSGMPVTIGDNISPTLGADDKDELKRIFDGLAGEGEILMPLEKTFWSELYGMVRDKFGVIWQVSHIGENMK